MKKIIIEIIIKEGNEVTIKSESKIQVLTVAEVLGIVHHLNNYVVHLIQKFIKGVEKKES